MEVSAKEVREVLDVAFSRLLLSHYRNQLIHLFLSEAMLALSVSHCLPCTQSKPPYHLLSYTTPTSPSFCHTAAALKRFETLHCALAREFVLPLSPPRDVGSRHLEIIVQLFCVSSAVCVVSNESGGQGLPLAVS